MLGTIFENLLAEIDPDTEKSARKSTGSFYTPREIVDYMVEESLVQYLKTHTNEEEEILHLLFKENDLQADFFSEKNKLIEAFNKIKILDPACGSGAYPMGALHKINMALQKLDPDAEIWKNKQLEKIDNKLYRDTLKEKLDKSNVEYIRKLGIIQHSVYGIDIQPIATEISKLRSFLSLVVDENINDQVENRGIYPLPNLEFKFVTANTLIDLEKEKKEKGGDGDNYILGSLDFGQTTDDIEQLQKNRNEYLQAYGNEKNEIKAKFIDLQKQIAHKEFKTIGASKNKRAQQIIGWNPFSHEKSDWFNPKWMFGIEKFDVVIGNPPYGAKIPKEELITLKTKLKDTKNTNSAAIFIDFAKNRLISNNGILSFIVPKSLLFSEKWSSQALKLSKHTTLLADVEVAFENVLLEQVFFVFNKNIVSDEYLTLKFKAKNFLKKSIIKTDTISIFKVWLCDISERQFKIGKNIISKNIKYFSDFSYTTRGLPFQKHLVENAEIKIIGGKNIKKYFVNGFKGFLNNDKIINNKKAISILIPKIISQRLVAHIQNPVPHLKITSTVDVNGEIMNVDTVENTILTNDEFTLKFLTSILNSIFCSWYVYKFIFCSAVRTMDLDNYYIGKIPVPVISKEEQKPFEEKVDEIMRLKELGEDTSLLENEIDQMVYQLYGLTEDEIKIVEGKDV